MTNGIGSEPLLALEWKVLSLIAEEEPLARVLDALVIGLEQIAAPGTLASLLLVDRESRVLRHASAPHLPPEYSYALDGAPIGPVHGSCGTAAHRKELVVVTDIATDPLWDDWRNLAEPHGLRACWSMPILAASGDVIGTLAFYYREPRSPTAAELAAIEAAARVTRIVLEREHAARARSRAARREAAVHAAARVLAEAEETGRAMHDVVGAVASALDWDAGAVWLVDTEKQRVSCAASWSRDSDSLRAFMDVTCRREFAPGEGLPGRVFASGRPEWIVLPADDSKFLRSSEAYEAGLSVGLAFPVEAGRQVLGAIEVFSRSTTPVDAELLTALHGVGLQVGQFLRRAREHEARIRLLQELQDPLRFSELFAGVLAHDLRTPLNTLVMGTALLDEDETDPRKKNTLARMRSSADRMTRMIEQLLDVTRLRSGNGISVERRPVDLGELARAVANEVSLAFAGRTVSVDASEVRGQWDADRLGQVLSNLLGNALQHGDASTVITLRVESVDPNRVRIEVHNGGVIPPEHLPWLFDPFRSGEGPKRKLGLGLGLFITKEIVRAHGGDVRVTSDVGGTRFCVELPRFDAYAHAAS